MYLGLAFSSVHFSKIQELSYSCTEGSFCLVSEQGRSYFYCPVSETALHLFYYMAVLSAVSYKEVPSMLF